MKIDNLQEKIRTELEKYGVSAKYTPEQIHNSVSAVVMNELCPQWDKSRAAHDHARKASYLSMEFLVGRAIYNNLLCLGLTDDVSHALKNVGADIDDMEEIEDAALGNRLLLRIFRC